jgi:hypothetical protein
MGDECTRTNVEKTDRERNSSERENNETKRTRHVQRTRLVCVRREEVGLCNIRPPGIVVIIVRRWLIISRLNCRYTLLSEKEKALDLKSRGAKPVPRNVTHPLHSPIQEYFGRKRSLPVFFMASPNVMCTNSNCAHSGDHT